jgi:pimeloyl-ACP methyl ester carboxylesterase
LRAADIPKSCVISDDPSLIPKAAAYPQTLRQIIFLPIGLPQITTKSRRNNEMNAENQTSFSSTINSGMAAEKPPVILAHCAFARGFVWGHVAAKLQAAGHEVVTIDLPGRPANPMKPDKVSLELYRDTVVTALDNTQRPAIVVGHSRHCHRCGGREVAGEDQNAGIRRCLPAA